MKERLISVVVPVYNAEKYLYRCIGSILEQTYKNVEIILVDDGSEDTSGAVCDQYAVQSDRVRVIHQDNAGVSSARNAGLKAALGEYVIFMDSDDYIETNMYEEMMRIIDRYHCDVVLCDCEKEFPDHSEKYTHQIRAGFYDRKQLEDEYYPALLITENMEYPATISNCLCMFRKSILNEEVYYEPGVRYSEDWLFGTQILIRSRSFYYMKGRYFYHYRMNEDSATHKPVCDKWKDYSILYEGFEKEFSQTGEYDFKSQLNRVLLFLVYNAISSIHGASLPMREKGTLITEILDDSRVKRMFRQVKILQLGISNKQRIITVLYKYKIGIPLLVLYFNKKRMV